MKRKKSIIKKESLLLLVAVLLLFLVAPAHAAAPTMINYEGVLEDNLGNPIDGTVSIVFTIYDASTGGASLWTETQASVAVSNGLFNVLLGAVTPLTPGVFTSDQRWLGVKVEADAEMTPRYRLASVGYALNASGITTDDAGSVGIGTTAPAYTLHVNGTIGTTNSGQVHSDYVFEQGYDLMNLNELEGFIKKEKHLPGIITDPEKTPDIDLLSLNGKLLAKIEELTLYIIDQNKKILALEEKVGRLEDQSK